MTVFKGEMKMHQSLIIKSGCSICKNKYFLDLVSSNNLIVIVGIYCPRKFLGFLHGHYFVQTWAALVKVQLLDGTCIWKSFWLYQTMLSESFLH